MKNIYEEFFNDQVKKEVDNVIKKQNGQYLPEENFISLVTLIKNYRDEARELYDDFVQGEFTVNSIEAEGAYRILTTLYNEIVAYYIPEELEKEIKNL